jgi:hypothetical protein
MFWLFFAGLLLWPSYLAIAIPGLPRVTVTRIISVPLLLFLLLSTSTSREFRTTVASVLNENKLVWRLLVTFTALQVVSVIFSSNKAASVNVLINVATTWISIYFVGVFVMDRKDLAARFSILLCGISVLLGFLAIWEQFLHHVPWQGHVPSFLQVNDPVVDRILAGAARQGKAHRVQGTFTTSLVFAEYLALTVPFLLNFMFGQYKYLIRFLAAASFPIVSLAILLTQARTGLLGLCISILIYPISRLWLYWWRNKSNLIASTFVILTPFIAASGLLLALVVPAIRIRLVGGGTEQASNEGRTVQMHMGIPKVMNHPWGHGVGQGAETLGWTNAAGMLSIDSYPLRLALEYGIFGLCLWICIIFAALWHGTRFLMEDTVRSRESQLILPVLISIVSYLAMKINFAQEDNQPVFYALLALLAVLTAHGARSHRYGSSCEI